MLRPVEITSHNESKRSIGHKQWALLQQLEGAYKDVDMSKISYSSSFLDDRWDVSGNGERSLNWSEWSQNRALYPLILLCKVAVYCEVQYKNRSIDTLSPRIGAFIREFGEVFEAKSILCASKGQPFNGLSQLSNEDILNIAMVKIARGNRNSLAMTGLHLLSFLQKDYLMECDIFIKNHVTYLWIEKGQSTKAWMESLAQAHGIDTNINSYSPLDMGSVSHIVKSADLFLTKHYDEIIDAFKFIQDYHLTNPPQQNRRLNTSIGEEFEARFKNLNELLPFRYYESEQSENKGLIQQSWYTEFEQLVQSACAWIILLTTGLRNVDMRNLKKGNCIPSKRSDLIYYLIADIKKTKKENWVIPVPEKTHRAFELASNAKINNDGEFILAKSREVDSDPSTQDNRKFKYGYDFNKLLKRFTSRFNINVSLINNDDEEGEYTAHCVRATLAGWIGVHSSAAILILKRLFGHSNSLMPDAYLNHNPLVIKERKNIIIQAQKQLAEDISIAVTNRNVAGKKAKQLIAGSKAIEDSLTKSSKSLDEGDLKVTLMERLKETLLDRITNGQVYAFLTPMSVICLRSTSNGAPSPCAKKSYHALRKESGIDKEIVDFMSTRPNPSMCVGAECSDALIGGNWSDNLLKTFDFYINLIRKGTDAEIDLQSEAKAFVSQYAPILFELYEDIREEGYFG